MEGLIGFGALVARARAQQDPPESDPAPNIRPCEHLGDLDALGETLRVALG
jgi:hypothetical protein